MSDSILGIEDLLGRYQAAGETESSGAFTLDPRKAMERLSEFQLPSHYHWILKVVQGLHRAGARTIEIEAGINKVRLGADAVPKGLDSVDDLLQHLLVEDSKSDPVLRHLAAGLHGSLAVKPRDIRATLTEDGMSRSFILREGGWREGPKEPAEAGEFFRLYLERSVHEKLNSSWFTLNTDIFDLFFSRRGAYDKENAVVYDYCPFADCQITLSGKPISRRNFGQPRFPGYKVREDMNPGTSRPSFMETVMSRASLVGRSADMKHHLVEKVVPRDTPGGFKLAAHTHATISNRDMTEIAEKAAANGLKRAYGLQLNLDPLSLLVFVEDGVIIDQRSETWGCPGLVMLVDGKEFKKDLTTLRVVKQDGKEAELKAEAKQVHNEFKELVEANIEQMPDKRRIRDRLLGSN